MKSTYFLFAILLVGAFQVKAQQTPSCNHANPTTESLKNIKSLLGQGQKSTDLKVIPVVFHVLHQNGPENISDAQIWDALDILNKNFQKLNADTIDVVSPFDTIIGKVNFEFRLATIDPAGNPTNGIDRILTPLTNVANDQSKVNSWNPLSYVNIWVVRSIGFSGVSGYTYNPVSGTEPCTDGIVMLNDYIGSIGTGSPFRRFFLTHEMGHFFGLFHPFDDDLSSPNPCNYTDGIFDTPRQAGISACNLISNVCDDSLYPESFDYWGFDVQDQIQNFMTTSFCMNMFTKQQALLMRSVAESPLYNRDYLWTTANLIATGTGPSATPPVSEAAPKSNFSISSSNIAGLPHTYGMICVGENIQFKTQNALVPSGTTTYLWSFPGASPASSVIENPTVSYANPGYYDVTLTATSPHGSTTTTRTAMIYVSGSWPEFIGPTVQNFDVSGDFWQSQNMQDDGGYFQRIATSGVQNTGCFLLGNHYEENTSEPCYSASPLQINQSKDNLISPAFDLSTTSNVTVSFDYAYGSAAAADTAYEVLKIYSSRDCGKTWTLRKTLTNVTLDPTFAPQSSNFIPSQTNWKQDSFTYTANATDMKTRFRFEFTASNYSNNLYIDNFVIDGILGISDNELDGVIVSPNPSPKGGTIVVSGLNASKADLRIRDLQGKLVYQKELVESQVQLNTDLRSGCYLVEVTQNGSKFLTRLIIE